MAFRACLGCEFGSWVSDPWKLLRSDYNEDELVFTGANPGILKKRGWARFAAVPFWRRSFTY